MEEKIRKEILNLHDFFQSWFSGKVEQSESLFGSNVSDHFDPSFEFVMPDGSHSKKEETISSIYEAYGFDPSFAIKVDIRSIRALSEEVYLALYEEHQTEEGQENSRLSLAVLCCNPSSKNEITWLHCHETPLGS